MVRVPGLTYGGEIMIRSHRALLSLFLILLFLMACEGDQESTFEVGLGEGPRIGYRAPNFRLMNLEGEEISLAKLKGKVVFINFWATWCVPCKIEMPSMQALYDQYKEDGFEVLAISNDFKGAEVVEPFVTEMGLTYPILLDSDLKVNTKYLIRSVPTSIIVGRDGVITHILVGARNWDAPEAQDLIKKLLKAST